VNQLAQRLVSAPLSPSLWRSCKDWPLPNPSLTAQGCPGHRGRLRRHSPVQPERTPWPDLVRPSTSSVRRSWLPEDVDDRDEPRQGFLDAKIGAKTLARTALRLPRTALPQAGEGRVGAAARACRAPEPKRDQDQAIELPYLLMQNTGRLKWHLYGTPVKLKQELMNTLSIWRHAMRLMAKRKRVSN
jgi:hypothetical protein